LEFFQSVDVPGATETEAVGITPGGAIAGQYVTPHGKRHGELGGQTLWLGVWERNSRAIAFYTKCGFINTCKRVFVLGSDSQTDQVMVKSLDPAR
jgi:ribosomal protein S18 acetylase RimI-like enzyme